MSLVIQRPAGTDKSAASSWAKASRFVLRRGSILIFLILLASLALRSPAVLSVNNFWASLVQAAPIAVVAVGLAVVVMGGGDHPISGGIDLSIPGSAALASVVISLNLQDPNASFLAAFLLALVTALVVGIVNAVLVAAIGLSPILATLATYVSAVGLAQLLSGGKRLNVAHDAIVWVRDGEVAGIPIAVLVMVAAVAIIAFVMHRTRYGARVQAVGGSRAAAVSAGLAVRRTIASTYVIAALVASVAAVLLVARGSGSSPGIDERLLVDMVLATFVGAAFSARNVVTVPGAALGAVLVAFLSNALILNSVGNTWIEGWKGLLILVVVSAAALQNRDRA